MSGGVGTLLASNRATAHFVERIQKQKKKPREKDDNKSTSAKAPTTRMAPAHVIRQLFYSRAHPTKVRNDDCAYGQPVSRCTAWRPGLGRIYLKRHKPKAVVNTRSRSRFTCPSFCVARAWKPGTRKSLENGLHDRYATCSHAKRA